MAGKLFAVLAIALLLLGGTLAVEQQRQESGATSLETDLSEILGTLFQGGGIVLIWIFTVLVLVGVVGALA